MERTPKGFIPTTDGDYLIEPKDALTAIKRLRARGSLTIFCMANVSMPTTPGYYFPALASIELTLRQATRYLTDLQRTHDTRVNAEKDEPLLKVKLSASEGRNNSYLMWI